MIGADKGESPIPPHHGHGTSPMSPREPQRTPPKTFAMEVTNTGRRSLGTRVPMVAQILQRSADVRRDSNQTASGKPGAVHLGFLTTTGWSTWRVPRARPLQTADTMRT
jgi:hypothetical protein